LIISTFIVELNFKVNKNNMLNMPTNLMIVILRVITYLHDEFQLILKGSFIILVLKKQNCERHM